MGFIIGLSTGLLIALFVWAFFHIWQRASRVEINQDETMSFIPTLNKKPRKKKPIFISEAEQAKRELREPPLDPGF